MEQIVLGVTYNQRSHVFHVLYVYTNNEKTRIAREHMWYTETHDDSIITEHNKYMFDGPTN